MYFKNSYITRKCVQRGNSTGTEILSIQTVKRGKRTGKPKHKQTLRSLLSQILQTPLHRYLQVVFSFLLFFFFFFFSSVFRCSTVVLGLPATSQARVGAGYYTDTSDALAATLPDLGCRRSSMSVSACPHKATHKTTRNHSYVRFHTHHNIKSKNKKVKNKKIK
jgi:hypothetical protein